MAQNDQVTQILVDQMKIQNELTRAMKDEIHKLSTTMTQVLTELQIAKRDLQEMDSQISKFGLRLLTVERDIQKLEPFAKAGEIIKGLIIKAAAYGAVAIIFFYVGREVEWSKLLPLK